MFKKVVCVLGVYNSPDTFLKVLHILCYLLVSLAVPHSDSSRRNLRFREVS